MVLSEVGKPLQLKEVPKPTPQPHQVLIRILCCAICRTDRHILDGELPTPHLPLILGHQIVGVIEKVGDKVVHFHIGDRVGVPWLGGACQTCGYCQEGRENLCDQTLLTGYQINGGFAEYCVADGSFIFSIPENYTSVQVAPLLCGGLIGYRALRLTTGCHPNKNWGFWGFGSSAHILTQIVHAQGGNVYAFTKKGHPESQLFAKKMGVIWAGDSDQQPPIPLDAAILFAPVGELIPKALKSIKKGAVVVCAGIHMSDIPSFAYKLLWGERVLRSVANLTRQDGIDFFSLISKISITTEVSTYRLEEVNKALDDLRKGAFLGSAVIIIDN